MSQNRHFSMTPSNATKFWLAELTQYLDSFIIINSTSWSRAATAWRRCMTSSTSRPTAPSSVTRWSGDSCAVPAASRAALTAFSTYSFLSPRVVWGKSVTLSSFMHAPHILTILHILTIFCILISYSQVGMGWEREVSHIWTRGSSYSVSLLQYWTKRCENHKSRHPTWDWDYHNGEMMDRRK